MDDETDPKADRYLMNCALVHARRLDDSTWEVKKDSWDGPLLVSDEVFQKQFNVLY